MRFYRDRTDILQRLVDRVDDLATSFEGPVYRFVDPKHAKTSAMFAGKGPLYADGRWLLQGRIRATYTSLLPETALAEALAANRYYGFPDSKSAPLVFVTAEAKVGPIIDLTDGHTRQRLRISEKAIVTEDWRRKNMHQREAITQVWGWALAKSGVEGFLCPSAALAGQTNLIVFPQKRGQPRRLTVTSEVKWPRR